jgi:hypothetical protein
MTDSKDQTPKEGETLRQIMELLPELTKEVRRRRDQRVDPEHLKKK